MRGTRPRHAAVRPRAIVSGRFLIGFATTFFLCLPLCASVARADVPAAAASAQADQTTDQRDRLSTLTNIEPGLLLLFGSVLFGVSASIRTIRARKKPTPGE